jgi:hypothetical protein
LTDEPDPPTFFQSEVEIVENLPAFGIAEVQVFEDDAGAARNESSCLMVPQLVRRQERGKGFGEASRMLGCVDESDRKIACGAQHRQSKRTDENDIACGR